MTILFMNKEIAKKFYLREEIQRAILAFSNQREIGSKFEGYFGKRPDVIEYLSDVKKFVNNGILSFHCSEERWVNPLMLSDKKISEEEKAKNRSGWDLILDLDGVDFKYAKIVGKIIIEYLNNLGVYNVSTKFSGNKGFHIGVPFEAFSKEIIGIGETRLLFPDAPRRIAAYLMNELKSKICKEILKNDISLENISQKYNISVNDLKSLDKDSFGLNYMKLIEIDTILISGRHLFRMPYSLNEKSGLVSIPVENSKIMEFDKKWAQPALINPEKYSKFNFLKYDEKYKKDGDKLLIKAYEDDKTDELIKNVQEAMNKKKATETFEINEEVKIEDFPKTIQFILNNKFEDGRKRVIFLLLTFLHSIKWNEKIIEEVIYEWNKKQDEPLKRNYIGAQINWFRNQIKFKIISPPNFSNDNYFKLIGIPENIINEDRKKFKNITIKNPLHYVFILLRNKSKINQK